MFSTFDSQPEEWLHDDAGLMHTVCICVFESSAHARKWIHQLVPRNQNGNLVKWSTKGPRQRKTKRRLNFAQGVDDHFDEIDFKVHCVSSSEGEISEFTQGFYLMNFKKIRQELDEKGRNCLVFKITSEKEIKVPVLRAAKLVWIYFIFKYLKEAHGLDGFIYSDWFANDPVKGNERGLGVAIVNFMLKSGGINLQLSLPNVPGDDEADLLSDWFGGWCNAAKNNELDADLADRFEKLVSRAETKISWIRYACNFKVVED